MNFFKIITCVLICLLLVAVPNGLVVGNSLNAPTKTSVISSFDMDVEIVKYDPHDSLVRIDNYLISLRSNESFTQGHMIITKNGESVSEIFIEVTENDGTFLCRLLIDSIVTEIETTVNVLEPLAMGNSVSLPIDYSIQSLPFTNFWWDGVRYQSNIDLAYPRPSYSYYNFSHQDNIFIHGYKLGHIQFSSTLSSLWWGLPAIYVSAFIGAGIGTALAIPLGPLAPCGSAIGAWIGATIGYFVSVFQQALFSDDRGCLWVQVGKNTSTAWMQYMRIGPFTLVNAYGSTYSYPQPAGPGGGGGGELTPWSTDPIQR